MTSATRRRFLRGSLLTAATGALPAFGWAEAGAPAYLAAAKTPDGSYALCGLRPDGALAFQLPLPGRGHAAAAHPTRALAVAFARRPGTFALVIDCALGLVRAELTAPEGRHFYGHGAFDAAGGVLYTAENAYDAGEGRIGLWDAARGFTRLGEVPSGGVGPHEIIFDGIHNRLVVAHGGIETHPDSGRAKLNLPSMRPNLAYLGPEGGLQAVIEPPAALRLNSLRHLALRPDGLVAIAAQWQGDPAEAVPLLALHRFGESEMTFLSADPPAQRALRGYGGGAAFSGDGTVIGLTAPRGGRAHFYDAASGQWTGEIRAPDLCGLAPRGDGFLATDGGGGIIAAAANLGAERRRLGLSWDNHLVAL